MAEPPAAPAADLSALERQVQQTYAEVLAPLARPYAYELPKLREGVTGLPTVLLLGNHSSGKSTWINHVVGQDLQKTGLAPVDDGFTIILPGPTAEDLDGATVASHPQLPFAGLERLGAPFLNHLRMKIRPDLRHGEVALIDSPGMIDSAGSVSRPYDFIAAVRAFAELSDLIVFFFDPDKPGTTGETLDVFTVALGLGSKLLIVMNKVDRFEHIRDFARAYGALCWNLSKVIPHKDLPHIFTTYTPIPGAGTGSRHFPLDDFDAAREEIAAQVRRTPSRRADNMVSALHDHARQLLMHARVCSAIREQLTVTRLQFWGAAAVTGLLTAGVVVVTAAGDVGLSVTLALGGALLGLGVLLIGRLMLRRLATGLAAGLDAVFEQVYARELAVGDRGDLRSTWAQVKPRVLRALKAVGPAQLPLLMFSARARARLEKAVTEGIPAMRRQLGSPGAK